MVAKTATPRAVEREAEVGSGDVTPSRSPTSKDSTRHRRPVQAAQLSRTPPSESPRMWRDAVAIGRLRLLADRASVGAKSPQGKQIGTSGNLLHRRRARR